MNALRYPPRPILLPSWDGPQVSYMRIERPARGIRCKHLQARAQPGSELQNAAGGGSAAPSARESEDACNFRKAPGTPPAPKKQRNL